MAQQLHDYLAGRRRLYNRTMGDVADSVGVSRQTIASWESGATSPELAMVQRWAAALPLTEAELAEASRLALGGFAVGGEG